MNLYLYRVREVDGDLDPIDFGVLRAPNVDAAFDMVADHLQWIGWEGCVMPVRVYPTTEAPYGIFDSAGDYIDRDVVLPNRLTLKEIIARYDLDFDLQERLLDALKPVEKDDRGEPLYSQDEVDKWLKSLPSDKGGLNAPD